MSWDVDWLPCCSLGFLLPLALLLALGLWGPLKGCYYLLRGDGGGDHEEDG